MSDKERENFCRQSTLIVDHVTEVFQDLLDVYLTNEQFSLPQFIDKNLHSIYHMCHNKVCCSCSKTVQGPKLSRCLFPYQLDILLDTTLQKSTHNSNIKINHCCCPPKATLKIDELDSTLTRVLLVNYTNLVAQGTKERIALEELIMFKNKSVSHATKAAIPKEEYDNSIEVIAKSLLHVAKAAGKEEIYKKKIETAKSRAIDETLKQKYQTRLLEWATRDEELKRELPRIVESAMEKMCVTQKNINADSGMLLKTSEDNADEAYKDPLPEKILRSEVAERLSTGWKKVAINLHIEQHKIDTIIADKPNDVEEQAYAMLITWKRRQGRNPDLVATLCSALTICERKDIADIIEQKTVTDSNTAQVALTKEKVRSFYKRQHTEYLQNQIKEEAVLKLTESGVLSKEQVEEILNESKKKFLEKELRMVLVGKTGVGKSATGNTILGEERFVSDVGMSSITRTCDSVRKKICGQDVLVVDTPGIFDTQTSFEKIKKEIGECIRCAAPGPHAILFVMKLTDRYKKEDYDALTLFLQFFGESLLRHVIVVFTHGEILIKKKQTLDEYLSNAPHDLHELLQHFGNRKIAFDNTVTDDYSKKIQISPLLTLIESMKHGKKGTGEFYTNKAFEMAETLIIKKIESRLKAEMESSYRKMTQDIEAKCQREMNEKVKLVEEKFSQQLADLRQSMRSASSTNLPDCIDIEHHISMFQEEIDIATPKPSDMK